MTTNGPTAIPILATIATLAREQRIDWLADLIDTALAQHATDRDGTFTDEQREECNRAAREAVAVADVPPGVEDGYVWNSAWNAKAREIRARRSPSQPAPDFSAVLSAEIRDADGAVMVIRRGRWVGTRRGGAFYDLDGSTGNPDKVSGGVPLAELPNAAAMLRPATTSQPAPSIWFCTLCGDDTHTRDGWKAHIISDRHEAAVEAATKEEPAPVEEQGGGRAMLAARLHGMNEERDDGTRTVMLTMRNEDARRLHDRRDVLITFPADTALKPGTPHRCGDGDMTDEVRGFITDVVRGTGIEPTVSGYNPNTGEETFDGVVCTGCGNDGADEDTIQHDAKCVRVRGMALLAQSTRPDPSDGNEDSARTAPPPVSAHSSATYAEHVGVCEKQPPCEFGGPSSFCHAGRRLAAMPETWTEKDRRSIENAIGRLCDEGTPIALDAAKRLHPIRAKVAALAAHRAPPATGDVDVGAVLAAIGSRLERHGYRGATAYDALDAAMRDLEQQARHARADNVKMAADLAAIRAACPPREGETIPEAVARVVAEFEATTRHAKEWRDDGRRLIKENAAARAQGAALREALRQVLAALKMWSSGDAMGRVDVWSITKLAIEVGDRALDATPVEPPAPAPVDALRSLARQFRDEAQRRRQDARDNRQNGNKEMDLAFSASATAYERCADHVDKLAIEPPAPSVPREVAIKSGEES